MNLPLANNPLQLAQQYPISLEDVQSALLGSPTLAMMSGGWPNTFDAASAELLSQIPVNYTGHPTINRSGSGKSLSDR
jgi:hypothetical protein